MRAAALAATLPSAALAAALLAACATSPSSAPPAASPDGAAAVAATAAPSSAAPALSTSPTANSPSPAAIDDTAWSTRTSLTLETSAGPLVFHAVHHGTLYVEAAGQVLWLDPWSKGRLDGAPPADLILLTDIHQDHLDPAAIAKLKKPTTVILGPQAAAKDVPGLVVLGNGGKTRLGPFEVEATPMYNTKRGPEAGKLFHDRGRGNGYVLSFGGKRVYVSGDTECTPEMRALRDVDLAFVVMNLPFTMPPEEAAECIAAFAPKIVVPFHHRGSDLAVLDRALAGKGVTIEKLKFY